VANVRVHATTRRVVGEAFAEEKPKLQELPSLPFGSVLKLERRVSHEGSVGGNLYSVPDATRRRVVEVHTLADEIRIFEDGALIARHPVVEERGRRRVSPGHRRLRVVAENASIDPATSLIAGRPAASPRSRPFCSSYLRVAHSSGRWPSSSRGPPSRSPSANWRK
jgi:hypothetical protein